MVRWAVRRRFHNVTGFVLAGGESRRMGRPKQGLVLDHETMLRRQLRILSQVCSSVAMAGLPRMPLDSYVPVFADLFPGRGPLGGIYTGLVHTRTDYNLILACDLPFLRSDFLEYLCFRAIESAADATVPRTAGYRLQPLCAVYRRRIRGIFRTSLENGIGRISRLFPKVRCEILTAPELARHGFSEAIFANMNSPADYDAARRRMEAQAYS
ncbi:MAG TPA: molybdenum cofactor guanylyltransferase [Terriglobia bacterium]|nr:molybdenum cofactor guanylyltransferase [Terriglobia bacterium]